MTVRVKVNGLHVVVETDHPDAEFEHWAVRHDRGLIGAMRSFNVYELEARDSSLLHEAFDKVYKERTGRNYFSIY